MRSAIVFTKQAEGNFLLLEFNDWKSGWLENTFLIALFVSLAALAIKVWYGIRLRKAKEQEIHRLQRSLQQLSDNLLELSQKNESLVTEMHHRVKNNLQILSSLMNSQLAFMHNKAGRDALFHSKHRLYALSVVYQTLFQHGPDSKIDISVCIASLANYFSDEYHTTGLIKFEMNLVPLKVETNVAIPLSIILNELISNSLKFAFPGTQQGIITITLSAQGKAAYRLTYTDNGIGLPDDDDFLTANSLGKSLITGLARQLKGQIAVNGRGGMHFMMDFNLTV